MVLFIDGRDNYNTVRLWELNERLHKDIAAKDKSLELMTACVVFS